MENTLVLLVTHFEFQDYLDRMATVSSERNIQGESTAEDLVKAEVFKQTYIPQRLDEVSVVRPGSFSFYFTNLNIPSGHVL